MRPVSFIGNAIGSRLSREKIEAKSLSHSILQTSPCGSIFYAYFVEVTIRKSKETKSLTWVRKKNPAR